MSQVKVSTEAVAAAAGQTTAKAAEFETRVQAVRGLVADIVGSRWQGPAAEAFQADFHDWLAGAGEVHAALVSMGQLLGESSGVYQSTEQTVTAAIDGSRAPAGAPASGGAQ